MENEATTLDEVLERAGRCEQRHAKGKPKKQIIFWPTGRRGDGCKSNGCLLSWRSLFLFLLNTGLTTYFFGFLYPS
jgi:hypothetical protein